MMVDKPVAIRNQVYIACEMQLNESDSNWLRNKQGRNNSNHI
jgi:hypothetical protein